MWGLITIIHRVLHGSFPASTRRGAYVVLAELAPKEGPSNFACKSRECG